MTDSKEPDTHFLLNCQFIIKLLAHFNQRFDRWINRREPVSYLTFHAIIMTLCTPLFGAGVTIAFQNLIGSDPYFAQVNALKYAEWIRPYYFPDHKFTILGFIIAVFLASTSILFYKYIKNNIDKNYFNSKYIIIFSALSIFFTIYLTFNILLLKNTTPFTTIIYFIMWTFLWVMPLLQIKSTKSVLVSQKTPQFLIILILCEFIWAIFAFATGKTPLMLEYFDIPTATYLQRDKNYPRKLVDTIQYINDHHLWGNQNLYDPRYNPGKDRECLEGNRFDINITNSIVEFADINKNIFYIPNNQSVLCFIGPFLDSYNDLSNYIDEDDIQEYQKTIIKNKTIYKNFQKSMQNDDISIFLKANKINIIQTIHDLELVLHHHFQILNPLNEYSLGRSMKDIVSTYGGGFVLIAWLIEQQGGVNYLNFLQVIFGSYMIYVVCFTACAHYVLRDLRLTALVCAILIGSIKGLGFINLFGGVGYAPLRHFLDLFVIAALLTYLQRKHGGWLILAASLALAGLGLDRMLGLFPLAAFLALLFTRCILGLTDKRRFEIAVMVLTGLMGAWAMVWLGQIIAPNPFTPMFFDGVWGFPIPISTIVIILSFYCLALFYVLYNIEANRDPATASLGLYLIYASCLGTFYWLMVPNYGHRNAVLPIAAFAIACLIRNLKSHRLVAQIYNGFAIAVMAIGFLIWASFSGVFIREKFEYDRYIDSHQIYHWDFKKMSISSTADPSLFKEATTIIDEFSPARGGIHILSQHDALLTLISDRYSLMPYFEVGMFLNGPGQQDIIVGALKQDRPRYLFVDSCITCAIPPNFPSIRYLRDFPGAYYARTPQKINRLQQMSEVFAKISNEYRLIKTGHLISVYERIDK